MNDLFNAQRDRVNRKSSSLFSKISDEHLRLGAALYIRQSTGAQLREHQKSTARQYALNEQKELNQVYARTQHETRL